MKIDETELNGELGTGGIRWYTDEARGTPGRGGCEADKLDVVG